MYNGIIEKGKQKPNNKMEVKTMTRTLEIEFETHCKKAKTALNRFFKKFPQYENDMREQFEYMIADNVEHQDNGTYDTPYDWTWSVWFVQCEDYFYFAWIERR